MITDDPKAGYAKLDGIPITTYAVLSTPTSKGWDSF